MLPKMANAITQPMETTDKSDPIVNDVVALVEGGFVVKREKVSFVIVV